MNTHAKSGQPENSPPAVIEFLGVVASTHHFLRANFYRDTANVLYFTVAFRYRGRPPNDKWKLEARLFAGRENIPLGSVVPEVTHTGYEEARLEGEIPFRLSYGDRHPQFRLEIGSVSLAYATLDLGTYIQGRLDPGEVLLNLIEQGNLLRIPNEWPLIAVGSDHYTNIVPGTAMINRPSSELVQRLAAMTADRVRTMGDPSLWVWRPKHPQGSDVREERLFIVNDRFAECAKRLQQELENSYQISFGDERAGSIPFAYFQTRAFYDAVGDGNRALCVFGSKVQDNLEAVIDLRQLLGRPVGGRLTSSHLDQLYGTATSKKFHEHRLEELNYDEFEVDESAAEPSELAHRLQQATRLGVFLNSEPALVPYWVNFAALEMGMEAGRDPLLLSVGDAILAIRNLLESKGRIVVANLSGLLNPEFGLAAELTAEKIGLAPADVHVVNLTSSGNGFQAGEDETLEGPVVIVSPTDTYTRQIADVLVWLSRNRLQVIGLVPFVSAAEALPLNANDWHAAFVPVLRLNQTARGLPVCQVNPFLRRRK